jgi:Mrp family chromosome partitioning ATPase
MSCYDGEGTDLIAPYLAVNQIPPNNGGRVLLADLDLAKPTLHATFSIPQTPGVSDFYKSDTGPAITPMSFNNVSGLDILSAGKEFDGALQLSKSGLFAESMNSWKKKYDYIVLKMPPFSRSSLVMELADYIDDVIMVVESERVRREVIVQSTSQLNRAGINVFGVILNNYRYYLPQWLYKRL